MLRLRDALIKAGIIGPLDGVGAAVYQIEHFASEVRARVSEKLSDKADSMHACGLEFFELDGCNEPACAGARAVQSAADLVKETP